MISHWLFCAIVGAYAALLVLFLGINLGLRALPSGRRFLHRARLQGRFVASPGWHSAPFVKAVFLLSWIAGPLTGWFVHTALRTL